MFENKQYMFCTNCGKKIDRNSKFCPECGTATTSKLATGIIDENELNNNLQASRKQEFAGKVIKCPNCGEVLSSFELNCPSCGYELREVKASSAVKEFALKLEAIESHRESEKKNKLFGLSYLSQLSTVSNIDLQKISLIKSFAIPNSKEDILEFMILATSSMNMNVYDSANTQVSKRDKEINAAWFAKVQQVYEKAKRIYSTDGIFTEIEKLYEQCNREIKKFKKKGVIKWVLLFGWIPLLFVLIFGLVYITGPKAEAKEIERLENIVVEVQEALDKEEYKHALRVADSIDYQKNEIEAERKWDIEREYWVEKVIETAKENGVLLEYTYTEDVDNANDTSSEESESTSEEVSSTGGIDGFTDALESSKDDIQQNIDEFKTNLNSGDNTAVD